MAAMEQSMDRLFGYRWIHTSIISLAMSTLVSSQWPNSLLQSPVTCGVGYNYRTCLEDGNCMRKFITCQCIPQEVLHVLKKENELPMESVVICLYSIVVMGIGEPTCCRDLERNIPPATMVPPSRNTYWQFMVGRHFPLPTFHQKKQKPADIVDAKSMQIAKKSDTFLDILTGLERAIEEEIITEAINEVYDDGNVHGKDLNKVNDIRNDVSNVNEEVRHVLYELLSRCLAMREKNNTFTNQ